MFLRRMMVVLAVVVGVAFNAVALGGGQRLRDAPIDVSRGEYETALGKWNGLMVEGYEEKIRVGECEYRMIVEVDRSNGEAIERVTKEESLNEKVDSRYPCKSNKSQESYTVGALFYLVDWVISNPEEAARNEFHGFAEWYSARFDGEKGYASLFMGYGGYAEPIVIEDVKVLGVEGK